MKYIDAEKLTKAIEDKGLDCSFALKMERLDILALIASLQQEMPSLPSNLDEAAEKAALKAYPEKDALNKKATGHYDPNYPRRKAYQQGYEQAEKDLGALALGKLELS